MLQGVESPPLSPDQAGSSPSSRRPEFLMGLVLIVDDHFQPYYYLRSINVTRTGYFPSDK
jgi:hypothetical protein